MLQRLLTNRLSLPVIMMGHKVPDSVLLKGIKIEKKRKERLKNKKGRKKTNLSGILTFKSSLRKNTLSSQIVLSSLPTLLVSKCVLAQSSVAQAMPI